MKLALRLLIASLSLLLFTAAASANGLPVGAWYSPPGGLLLPAGGPPVSIQHETLKFRIKDREALVTAIYQLANNGAGTAGDVAFAIPGTPLGTVEVLLDGKRQQLQSDGAQAPQGVVPLTALPVAWLNPLTGASYAPKIWRQGGGTTWVGFSLALSPGQHELSVSYTARPGEDNSQLIPKIERYDYLLAPASRWASFGDLTIQVQTVGSRTLATNLDLKPAGADTWEGHFTALPQANLSLFVGPPGGGWLGLLWWGKAARFWTVVLLTVVVGSLAGAVPGPGGLGRPLWRAVRLLIPFGLLALLDRGIFEPNPIGNVVYIGAFVWVPLLYGLSWRIATKIQAKRTRAA